MTAAPQSVEFAGSLSCVLMAPGHPVYLLEPMFSAVSRSDSVPLGHESDSSRGYVGPITHRLHVRLDPEVADFGGLSEIASPHPFAEAATDNPTAAAEAAHRAGIDVVDDVDDLLDLCRAALAAPTHAWLVERFRDAAGARVDVAVLAELEVAEFPFSWMDEPGGGSIAWEFDPRDYFPHLDQGALIDELWDREDLPDSVLRGSLYIVAGMWIHPYADRFTTARALVGATLRWLSRGRRDVMLISPGMEPNDGSATSPLAVTPDEWRRVAPGWRFHQATMSDGDTMHHFGAGIGADMGASLPAPALVQIARDMDSHHPGTAKHFWRLLGRSKNVEWAAPGTPALEPSA